MFIDQFEADEDLRLRVNLFLEQRGHWPLQHLEVVARDGIVTLRGTVPSFHIRQHALACVRHVAGILRVIDEMEIARSPPIAWFDEEDGTPGKACSCGLHDAPRAERSDAAAKQVPCKANTLSFIAATRNDDSTFDEEFSKVDSLRCDGG